MAVNKVIYGDQTLIDLTADTVTPASLLYGDTAHDKSGALIVGTAVMAVTINNGGTVSLISGTTDDYLLTFPS